MACWGPEFLASLHDSSTPSFQPDLLVREIFEVNALPDLARNTMARRVSGEGRLGCGIDAPLCGIAVFLGRRIEIGAARVADDCDVAIRLASSRDRPVDLPIVKDVNVVIDDHDALHAYCLLNHSVRSCQHVGWNRQADLLGCFQIDGELEFCWLLHCKVGGLGAFENLIDVITGAPP